MHEVAVVGLVRVHDGGRRLAVSVCRGPAPGLRLRLRLRLRPAALRRLRRHHFCLESLAEDVLDRPNVALHAAGEAGRLSRANLESWQYTVLAIALLC